jgi:Tol biopolymer transport system component
MSRKRRGNEQRIAELERKLVAEDERLERILAARTRDELLDAEHEPALEATVAARPAVRPGFVIVALALAALTLIVWHATLAASRAPTPTHRFVSPPGPQAAPVPSGRSATAVAPAMPSITGQPQVFVMPASGGRARELNPDADSSPTIAPEWKPDGTALAVSTGAALLEVGVARGGPLRGQPVWRKRRPIASAPSFLSARYAPSGRSLAFVASDGNVWTTTPKTQALAQLTHDGGFDGYVDWSPSGLSLVASQRGRLVVLLDGGARRRIETQRDATWPRWSPTGRAIAFTGFGLDGWVHVFVTDPYGDRIRKLAIGHAASAEAAWSPDGRRLVYSKVVGAEWDLFAYDLRTHRERRLTATKGDESAAAWSPDGRWIAFVRNSPA